MLTLCNPIDGSPPGSAVPGILQARTLERVCHFLLQCMKVKSESEVAQSCPTPSDPMDCSLPGSSIHGIFQARVLEWGAIALQPILKVHDKWTLAADRINSSQIVKDFLDLAMLFATTSDPLSTDIVDNIVAFSNCFCSSCPHFYFSLEKLWRLVF